MRTFMKVAISAIVISLPSLVAAQDAPARITIASGAVSGGWYPMAGVLGELIKEKWPETDVTVTTGGGVENLPKVAAGLADIGFTQADIYASAASGTAPFEQVVPGTAALGYLGIVPQAFFFVREGSDYTAIEDIFARKQAIRLVVPPRNNGGELIIRRMLAEMDVTYDDIQSWGGSVAFMGYSEASGLIADGHADAYVGPVIGAIIEMITTNDMRVLIWPEEVVEAVLPMGYDVASIPAGRYNFSDAEMKVPALQNILVVSESADPKFVSGLAEILSTHVQDIQQSAAMFKTYSAERLAEVSGGPLHPGAEAFYAGASK